MCVCCEMMTFLEARAPTKLSRSRMSLDASQEAFDTKRCEKPKVGTTRLCAGVQVITMEGPGRKRRQSERRIFRVSRHRLNVRSDGRPAYHLQSGKSHVEKKVTPSQEHRNPSEFWNKCLTTAWELYRDNPKGFVDQFTGKFSEIELLLSHELACFLPHWARISLSEIEKSNISECKG